MAIRLADIRGRQVAHWRAAFERWRERSARQGEVLASARAGKDSDDPARIVAFARREASRTRSSAAFRAVVRGALALPGEARQAQFLERRIGSTLDWSPVPSGLDAETAGRAVARLCSSPELPRNLNDRSPTGFATGFLVSRSLLLTNHHVFASASDARGTFAQFGYEQRAGQTQPGVFFELQPELFFVSDEQLDFALVAVSARSFDNASGLDQIPALRLSAERSKILLGHPVAIIQHPDGAPKRYAEKQNRLLDLLDHQLQYETDTLPGSSGSPCFNRSWDVVGLHHSGVPRMVGDRVQTLSGDWDPRTMGDDQIDWIANEGIRISSLVAHLQSLQLPAAQAALRQELFEHAADVELDVVSLPPPPAGEISAPKTQVTAMPNTVINIQGNATIYVGSGTAANTQQPSAPVAPESKLRFDPDYEARPGYDADFLEVRVPLPNIAPARRREMLRDMSKILVLKYHHFSLAINKRRRFQMWSAVNVDYSAAARRFADNRDAFGTDTWIADPRIPERTQVQDAEFYKPATRVDRGHVVRRDDNCWGLTQQETEFANSDTFHWTNCTPQHEAFNQSRLRGLWGQLEDVVKEQALGGPERLSVFAGPVLADDDPDAYDIQYPVKFWKVVTAIVDGELASYGFVLDQSPVIDRLGLEEQLDFGKFTLMQQPLRDISTLTGVEFPEVLLDADVLKGQPSQLIESREQVKSRARTRPAQPLLAV